MIRQTCAPMARSQLLLVIVATMLSGALSTQATAGFIVLKNTSADENILLDKDETGTTVSGLSQSGSAVDISSTQTLLSLANGQATVGVIDGGLNAIPITAPITIASSTPGIFMTALSFNVSQSGQPAGVNGDLQFTVYPVLPNGSPLPPVVLTMDDDGDDLAITNGQNRYLILATGGMQFIAADVEPVGGSSYPSLVQVRVELTPEPGAAMLACLSIVAIGFLRATRLS